jgi:hypothetical protein
MKKSLQDIEHIAATTLSNAGHGNVAQHIAKSCAWLEACGYPGLKLIREALADPEQSAELEPDLMGLDLKSVSCIFLAPQIEKLRAERGRIFLRNVRHGLYLVPGSIEGNYGIGCPIDPGFALGGERIKNPYVEKLEAAQRNGVEVDDVFWQSLTAETQ